MRIYYSNVTCPISNVVKLLSLSILKPIYFCSHFLNKKLYRNTESALFPFAGLTIKNGKSWKIYAVMGETDWKVSLTSF